MRPRLPGSCAPLWSVLPQSRSFDCPADSCINGSAGAALGWCSWNPDPRSGYLILLMDGSSTGFCYRRMLGNACRLASCLDRRKSRSAWPLVFAPMGNPPFYPVGKLERAAAPALVALVALCAVEMALFACRIARSGQTVVENYLAMTFGT